MITTATPRRRAGQRIASALWGLLVIGAGVTMGVAFSGYEIDLELAAIIALTAVGGWLILSAALSSIGRSREVREATAPVVEEALRDVDDTLADVDRGVTEAAEEAVAATAPMPAAAPSEPTPTEVIFTDATTPDAPTANAASDSSNQNEPQHAESADSSAPDKGVADADPVQSVGDEDPEARRD